MGIHFSHILRVVWISTSPKILQKPKTLECLLFTHTFPVLWESTFPMFWELHRFLIYPQYLREQ